MQTTELSGRDCGDRTGDLHQFGVDLFTGTEQTLAGSEICVSPAPFWVRWLDEVLVDNWYLKKVHLGGNDDHMICSNLHPVR